MLFCVITQRVVIITNDALLLAVRSDSPETVEVSRRVLFLSSSRVWGFFIQFFILNFPTNKVTRS